MKRINIYFQAVTKVSMAHLEIEDDETIESYMATWLAQGYVKAHYAAGKAYVFVPWQNVVYCQCLNI